MASNYIEIEKALVTAVRVVDNVTPMGYPNRELTELPDGLWLQVSNLPSGTLPATLGDAGWDSNLGSLQIDINYPQNQGTKIPLLKADNFAGFFTAGKPLLYNAQEVKVLSTSLSPGRYVGGYYRISLTVRYSARTTRA